MFFTKNVVDVVFELLSAYGADDMILAWFGFIDADWVLFSFVLLPAHILNIIHIFLVKENRILLSKLALFL